MTSKKKKIAPLEPSITKKKKIAPLEPPKTRGERVDVTSMKRLTPKKERVDVTGMNRLTPNAGLKKSRADSIKYEDPGFRRIPSPLTQAVKNMKKGGRVRMDGTAKPR